MYATFADIPASLPPILKAKNTKKAAKKVSTGKKALMLSKSEEELKELKHEIQQNNKENSQEELEVTIFYRQFKSTLRNRCK